MSVLSGVSPGRGETASNLYVPSRVFSPEPADVGAAALSEVRVVDVVVVFGGAVVLGPVAVCADAGGATSGGASRTMASPAFPDHRRTRPTDDLPRPHGLRSSPNV